MNSHGIRSSEFWVAIVAMLICGFLVYDGKMTVQEAVTFAGIPSAYILSRGLAKNESK